MTRHIRIWRWCFTITRGGQATPWPWIEFRIGRRAPKQAQLGVQQDRDARTHPGETWRWPTECEQCYQSIGPWSPDVPGSEMTHILDGGGPDWVANQHHAPVLP